MPLTRMRYLDSMKIINVSAKKNNGVIWSSARIFP